VHASFLLIAVSCLIADGDGKELAPVELHGARREPVAAVFLDDNLAAIACAKSGTLIFWDVPQGKTKSEYQVGRSLRGVARFGDDELLVIDDKSHELIQLQTTARGLAELKRYPVAQHPIHLSTWRHDGKEYVVVASLWSRQLSVWSRPEAKSANLSLDRTVDLPFEPRLVLPVSWTLDDVNPTRTYCALITTDAFGGEVAQINPFDGRSGTKQFAAHNIGGLAYYHERQEISFSHQVLESARPITVENLGNGSIIRNQVTLLGIALNQRQVLPLSRLLETVADPAGIAFTPNRMLVALAGTDEVWVAAPAGGERGHVPVGKRPRFIATRGQQALVLGELDDSVTQIDVTNIDRLQPRKTLLDPASANRKLTPAERGERLFFDARMSAGGMMSCHSCHTDGHTNGLLADTLGDNTHGTPKRVLTLRGTRMTDLWAWNGEMKTLQDNVHKSLQDTMHAPKIEPRDVDDLVSFLHTLPPVEPLKPVPKDDADRAQVARGEKVFAREGCATCHVPPLTFTSHAAYDVGLEDEKGLKKFNPPSLRGVGRLRKLFHDNRASSLKDVFETYGHQLKEPLSERDLADLVRYLESL
jgi:hypothetical protein